MARWSEWYGKRLQRQHAEAELDPRIAHVLSVADRELARPLGNLAVGLARRVVVIGNQLEADEHIQLLTEAAADDASPIPDPHGGVVALTDRGRVVFAGHPKQGTGSWVRALSLRGAHHAVDDMRGTVTLTATTSTKLRLSRFKQADARGRLLALIEEHAS